MKFFLAQKENFYKSYLIANLANTIRESTHSISHFKTGSRILLSVSVAIFLGSSYCDKQHKLRQIELISKALSPTPISLNKLIAEMADGSIENILSQITPDLPTEKFIGHSAIAYGEFDHSKEIHVRRKINQLEGFSIFTPFYYYKENLDDGPYYDDPKHKTHQKEIKGGILVNRGW
jgi:hypothetical protein